MELDPTILITGGSGQVGRALRAHLPSASFPPRSTLDITDLAAVRQATAGVSIVIHLAAMTNVDECERKPDVAHEINSVGTKNVVLAAQEQSARVLYVSTDYVFDGKKPGEYSEDDEPRPINVYGETKLEGERHVASAPSNLVVRTSWVYGEGNNFVRAILATIPGRRSISVVGDQRGRPTWANNLAASLAVLAAGTASGVVNVSDDGPVCSRAELAETILRFRSSDVIVEPIMSNDYTDSSKKAVARRPVNSALSLARARKLGLPVRDWRSSLNQYLRETS